jgi:hypothetical protein
MNLSLQVSSHVMHVFPYNDSHVDVNISGPYLNTKEGNPPVNTHFLSH